MSRPILIAISLILAGCDPDVDPPADAGFKDAGFDDAAVADSGPADSGALPVVGCDGCLVFTGGVVFDGTQAELGTVVIEGARVREVRFGEVEIEAGEVIDLAGKSIMPGLFDMHVHTPASAATNAFLPIDPYEPHFKAMLRSGVTSYLDLGTSQRSIFEYRRRLAAGQLLGPRLFAAGPLVTPTGGHPCYRGSPPGDACLFVDSATEADALLPAVLAMEPDVVKVVVESGVLQIALPQLTAESIGRVNALAEAAGVPVIAHVSEAEDVEIVLDQGVRALAHVPAEDEISEALAARMASLGLTMVPTLVVFERLSLLSHAELAFLDEPSLEDDVPAAVIAALRDPANRTRLSTPEYMAWSAGAFDRAQANFRRAAAAGVRIAAGTDAGNPGTFHGLALIRELELFVANGLDPVAALTAATKNAADLLSRNDLGRLEPEAIADLVIVEGDVRTDVSLLRRPLMVYRDGALIDRDALALPRGTSLVLSPIEGLAEGTTCLYPSECSEGTYCGYQGVCAAECSFLTTCESGSACFPQEGSQTQGFCYDGDGCDPLLQTCENGEACIWLGNAATLCWSAGRAAQGASCDPGDLCAPGFQCDFQTRICNAICDPGDPMACPSGTMCVDVSANAGLLIGECR